MTAKHDFMEEQMLATGGQRTTKFYADQAGLSLAAAEHMRIKLGLTGHNRVPLAVPSDATHRHRETMQFYKQVGDRVFRQSPEGWVLSNVDMTEKSPRGKPMLKALQ